MADRFSLSFKKLFHFPAENRVSNLSFNLRYIYYNLKIENVSFMIIVDKF